MERDLRCPTYIESKRVFDVAQNEAKDWEVKEDSVIINSQGILKVFEIVKLTTVFPNPNSFKNSCDSFRWLNFSL